MSAARLTAIGTAMAAAALGAGYLWATRGAAILLDLSSVFCL